MHSRNLTALARGCDPLLGNSVFLTNGDVWKRQRRIIDPAFEGGRLRDTFPGILAAADAGVGRIAALADGQPQEIEAITSHIAADVIFRTLFSIQIEDETAQEVFQAFRSYQRTQPILNLAAFIQGPKWMPRFFRSETRQTAATIRRLITKLTKDRLDMIAAGGAPDDLATKILTTKDPVTGDTLSLDEMVDQVAIFFLAGHETSASALAWHFICWRNTRTGRPSWPQKGRPMMGRLQISPVCRTPATFFAKLCVFIHLYR